MKNTLYIFVVGFLMLQCCSSQRKLEDNAPFVLGQVSCQDWVAGKEESGKGFILQLPIISVDANDIVFKNVFFRGRVVEPRIERANDTIMVICTYYTESAIKPDIIMHSDAKKEVGNQPPELKGETDKFPFELGSDEAVLSYTGKGKSKLKYFKIGGITDKPSRIYRSRPQN